IDDASLDVGPQLHFLATRRPHIKKALQDVGLKLTVAPQLDVVQYGHAPEKRNILEAAGQTQSCALWRWQAGDITPFELHRAGDRPIEARNGIEQGCLAGAVGPNHCSD